MASPAVPLPPQVLDAPHASQPSALPARPAGVTFACAISIALGVLGTLAGITLFGWGAFFTFIPIFGGFGFLMALAGLAVGAVGALGVATGVAGLRGAAWARVAMVVLYAAGAFAGILAFAFVLPLLLAGLNAAAIIFLLNDGASRWFDAVEAARGNDP